MTPNIERLNDAFNLALSTPDFYMAMPETCLFGLYDTNYPRPYATTWNEYFGLSQKCFNDIYFPHSYLYKKTWRGVDLSSAEECIKNTKRIIETYYGSQQW